MRKSEKFSAKIEVTLMTPEVLARQNIFNALNDGNLKIAKWYLERKRKEEFGLRHESKNENYQSNIITIKTPEV